MVHVYYLKNVEKRQTCIDYESTIYRYLMDQTAMIYKWSNITFEDYSYFTGKKLENPNIELKRLNFEPFGFP